MTGQGLRQARAQDVGRDPHACTQRLEPGDVVPYIEHLGSIVVNGVAKWEQHVFSVVHNH